MSEKRSLQLAAVIGIDWADQKHDIALQATDSSSVEHVQLRNTPEAIADWIAALRRRFHEEPVGIAVETSRSGLVHALVEHDFIVLYPVNPRSLQRFREAFSPSGAKDDRPDADLLRDLLLKHRDRLRASMPDDTETRALRRLTQSRRNTVEWRTQLTQRLREALKEYFPQALSWAGEDLSSALACDFLLKWPTLEAVQRARPNTVRTFYSAHNCRSAERIEERVQEMRTATALTRDRAILDSSVLLVQTLVRQLKALIPSIADFDREIKQRFEAHDDAAFFQALPGSGPALAPRLLAVFGSCRERFESAEEVQLLTGIAPVTISSGKRSFVRWRWSAPTFVRQTLHEFAHHSIRSSRWAQAYYEQQRERGHDHHQAVRSLAFKWIRVLWRCWHDRTPYDEARYIEALIRRGSPLAARLQALAA